MGATRPGAKYRFGQFVLDLSRGVLLSAEGQDVALRPKAFSLLCLLVENAGRLLDRDTIMQTIWPDVVVADDGVTQCVRDIRRALADNGQRIVRTVSRRGYIFAATVACVGDRSDARPKVALATEKPSVAVLPFTGPDHGPGREWFSDAIADDIITELSRSRSWFVVSRNSSFAYRGLAVDVKQTGYELGVRYLVKGSIRHEASRVRINAQLIDAETGNHIWAERYDRPRHGVFAAQDEITSAVVAAVRTAITDSEYRRVLRMPPANLGAWEANQRGLWHVARASPAELELARQFFARAIAIDPTFAPAYAAMAQQIETEATRWGIRSPTEARSEAIEWAEQGVAIDPYDADTRATLARLLFSAGRLGDCWEHLALALTVNSNSPRANFVKGEFLVFGGRPTEGRDYIKSAIRLDPRNAYHVDFLTLLLLSYYYEGAFDKAERVARRSLAQFPKDPRAHWLSAAVLGQLGRSQEAHAALHSAMTISPASFDQFVRSCPPWLRPEDFEHVSMIDGLRRAGWES
ncbi:MAG TPA: winged helix-turn-helix domain-containing protein [Acetobacteraceae bacterium]|nr:winged helix-turn-helix domain-containing protein [Acetobacteraceae bacterium]